MSLLEIILKSSATYMIVGITFGLMVTILLKKKTLLSKHYLIGITAFCVAWPFFIPILCHSAVSDKQFERVLQNAYRYHGNLGIVEISCLAITSGFISAFFIFGFHLF